MKSFRLTWTVSILDLCAAVMLVFASVKLKIRKNRRHREQTDGKE